MRSMYSMLSINSLNVPDASQYGNTPLSMAAKNGHHNVIATLLHSGSHVEPRDNVRLLSLTLTLALSLTLKPQPRLAPSRKP